MSVTTASRVAPEGYWRIVQGCCLLTLMMLAACQEEPGARSSHSDYSSTAPHSRTITEASRQTRPVQERIQWGLMPLTDLPRLDITATRPTAGVMVMRHSKQDRLRPRKLIARLLPQKSLARIKTAPRLTRQTALLHTAPSSSGGFDTLLARQPSPAEKKPVARAAQPKKQQIAALARPARTAASKAAIRPVRATRPARTIAELARPGSDGLSTGSINRERKTANLSPVKTYLSSPPKSGRYKLAILGDSLGVGIGMGLSSRFMRQGRFSVLKKAKEGSGLVRPDFYNWDKALARVVSKNEINIAIVQIGANDGQSIRSGGRLRSFGSKKWRREYIKRVDKFIARLKREHASIYWVEIPPMGRPKLNNQVKVINALIKTRMRRHGIKYISTWKRFANRFGQYTAFSRDANGRRVKIRAKDGVHFTMPGYRLLAAHVEKTISRDLALAQITRTARLNGTNRFAAR